MGNKKGAVRGPYKRRSPKPSAEFENRKKRIFNRDQLREAKTNHPLDPAAVIGKKDWEFFQQVRRREFRGKAMNNKRRERIERFQHVWELAKKEALDPCWRVEGELYNRYEMMKMVIALVSDGLTVAEVAKEPGYPPVWMIREWERLHVDFKRELRNAEQAMAEIRYQDSIDVVLEAENDDNAKLIQLKSEAHQKLAANTDGKWNTKQQIQVEDTTKPQSIEDAKQRLEAWARNNPELAKTMMPELYAQLKEQVAQKTLSYTDAEVEKENA